MTTRSGSSCPCSVLIICSRRDVRIRALGQAGFLFEGDSVSLAVDPYLSFAIERNGTDLGRRFIRRFPPPIAPAQLSHVAGVLITHAHDDHCDPETIGLLAATAPHVRYFGPSPVLSTLRAQDIPEERLVRVRSMIPIEVGPNCTITPLPSAHYGFDTDSDGEPAYLGYIVELDGTVCYHSGDTVLYDGLSEVLGAMQIDVALLPVNGRDAQREALGITGNLEPEEAFGLAREIGATVLIPMHNDLFDINRRDSEVVESAWRRVAPELQLVVLPPGGEMQAPSSRRSTLRH